MVLQQMDPGEPRIDLTDPMAGMVVRVRGVEVVAVTQSHWAGLSRLIIELRWLTEPGWVEFRLAKPSCLVPVLEIGGRCDIRSSPERAYEGDFFGREHASLVAAGTPVVVHADEMRRVVLVCCTLADLPSPEGPASPVIARSPTRLMLRNRPLHDCSMLFASKEAADTSDPFAQALAHTVLTAWAAAAAAPAIRANRQLRGERLRAVLTLMRNELDTPLRMTDLADRAGMPQEQFSREFQDATNLTPQAWQMDARVRCAQRLMVDDPSGSLAEYAALCGFADQSHFSRVFLKIVGRSPTEWLNGLG